MDQTPWLLFISAHNMVRLLFESRVYIIFESGMYISFSASAGVATIYSEVLPHVSPRCGIVRRLLRAATLR